jgi:C4-dicarboxylate-specific signal transduction histidine kinase
LLPFQLTIGVEKGLGLGERVAHQVAEAVTGADQAGDGGVPAEVVSERSVGASRWAAP